MQRIKLLPLAILVAALSLGACAKKGPVERAGEKVDHVVDTVKNGGEEPTGDKIQDEANKLSDKVSSATSSSN
jgi:predicted small lipoprotein YifL